MQGESKVCDAAETVYVHETSLGRAVERGFKGGGMIYPVVLSGGSGTRLWPMSRMLYPKQLLTLLGRESLLQQTVQRVSEDGRFAAPLLVANEEHRFIIAEQLREIAVVPSAMVLEPIGRNSRTRRVRRCPGAKRDRPQFADAGDALRSHDRRCQGLPRCRRPCCDRGAQRRIGQFWDHPRAPRDWLWLYPARRALEDPRCLCCRRVRREAWCGTGARVPRLRRILLEQRKSFCSPRAST